MPGLQTPITWELLSVQTGLPHLRPYRARSFNSNSCSNLLAFPNLPLSSHVLFSIVSLFRFRHRLYCIEYLNDFLFLLLNG